MAAWEARQAALPALHCTAPNPEPRARTSRAPEFRRAVILIMRCVPPHTPEGWHQPLEGCHQAAVLVGRSIARQVGQRQHLLLPGGWLLLLALLLRLLLPLLMLLPLLPPLLMLPPLQMTAVVKLRARHPQAPLAAAAASCMHASRQHLQPSWLHRWPGSG